MAAKYDDKVLEIWTGYAWFNKARSAHDLMSRINGSEKDHLKEIWKEEIMKSILIRQQWRERSSEFPRMIRDGLTTEYFHAVAERILRAEKDKDGRVHEDGESLINDAWVEEKRKEFHVWWDNPAGLRVRLAMNVRDNWRKIDKN